MDMAIKRIEERADAIAALSDRIWEDPEGSFEEEKASAWIADFLREEGFSVETAAGDIPTAIKAVFGEGEPVIGFLGEYDALPGLSQKCQPVKEAISGQPYGHGCAHNLLGAGAAAAACGMAFEMRQKGLSGTVVYYGCPGEELLCGKAFMAREGVFEGLDAALAWHPMFQNEVTSKGMVAMKSVKFHFKGVTSHAAADPQNGRSAQDGVELMNVGVNYLREHVTSDVRIHYAITNTGTVPNIVPDAATVWYYVRAPKKEKVEEVYQRVLKVAKGAAMMTETQVEIEFLTECYETMQNLVLAALVHEKMKEIPQGSYTKEELEFAQKLNEAAPEIAAEQRKKAGVDAKTQIHMEVPPISDAVNFASTDVGEVSHLAPTLFFTTAGSNIGAAGHSWQQAACAGHSIGHKGMLYGAKVMAACGIALIEEPELLRKAKKEFEERMDETPYKCSVLPKQELPVKK